MKPTNHDVHHAVYGLFFDGVLFYIGCTNCFEARIAEWLRFPLLRNHRGKVKARILAEATNNRSGKAEETRLLTEQILNGNRFIANAIPSVTLEHGPKEVKAAWRQHQLRFGSFPNKSMSRRRFRNWSERSFGRVLQILGGAK